MTKFEKHLLKSMNGKYVDDVWEIAQDYKTKRDKIRAKGKARKQNKKKNCSA
jgi:hypothetical protein